MPEESVASEARRSATWQMTGLAMVATSAFLASFVSVGADCYWLVAMGDHILATGDLPDGLPFAEAPTDGWPNVLVLAQVVMSWLHSLGGAALPVAQLVADAVALVLLAIGARRAGASDGATALVLVAVVAGSLASLAIVRLQLFSLVPFALLLLLLRAQARQPTRQVWWLPVLVALWSNLHGAVLLGVCVAGAYLLFSRLRIRPAETVAVGLATLVTLLATSAGWRTVSYYVGVMQNEAAKRGEGLWARPSLENPFDVIMILAAVTLVVGACLRRLPLWEYVVLAGLLVATAMAARHGIWLLMSATAPAAVSFSRRRTGSALGRPHARSAMATVGVVSLLAAVIILPRGDDVLPAEPGLVAQVAAAAGERVVLAPEPLAESLAVEGVTLWAVDPIDAFEPEDQRAFLDFLEGRPGMSRAVNASDAVVVEHDTEAAEVMEGTSGFTAQELTGDWTIYLRDES